MERECIFYKRGKCVDSNCKFFHSSKYKDLKHKFTKVKNKYAKICDDMEDIIKSQYIDNRTEDTDIICQDFLTDKCQNEKNCKLLHNSSLKNKETNNQEFKKALENMNNDFEILLPYERKIIGESNLDLLFICDCTGSMSTWISATKNTIFAMTNFIKDNNKCSKVRVAFVGYRDFYDFQPFEILDFTEDEIQAFNFIDRVDASGGDDLPEDVSGGLLQGLKLSWKSKAKYAILIADAPDHGYMPANLGEDNFPGGRNEMDLLSAIKLYAENDINFFAVEICKAHTEFMFEAMSKSYQAIARKPIQIENIENCKEKFAFFVAYGACNTLTSVSYSKFNFVKFVKSVRAFTQNKTNLATQLSKISATGKKSMDTDSLVSSGTASVSALNNKNSRLSVEEDKLLNFLQRVTNDLENIEENEEKSSKENDESIEQEYSKLLGNDNELEVDTNINKKPNQATNNKKYCRDSMSSLLSSTDTFFLMNSLNSVSLNPYSHVGNPYGMSLFNNENTDDKNNTNKNSSDRDLVYKAELDRYPLADFNDISDIEFEAVCHSYHIFKDFNYEINWKNPVVQHSTINSRVKIDFVPFSKGVMRYAYYMYDTFLSQQLVGKLPIKYVEKEYNLDFLAKDIESLVVADHIATDFNDRVINIIKDKRLLLNFVRAYIYEVKFSKNNLSKKGQYRPEEQIIIKGYNLFAVENFIEGEYEKYNNNAGWISENMNEFSFIMQAFSHFSWQFTKGFLMIVDLQGVEGILTDPQIHCLNSKRFGKGNLGYLGMMKFFLTHTCNQYCIALDLIHPKKDYAWLKVDEKFDFFVNKIKIPKNKGNVFYKCCDLCKEAAPFTEDFLYKMKRASKESYCSLCLQKLKESIVKKNCKLCNKEFVASEYGFKLKRIEIPENCGDCRLINRNKLREENE